MWCFGIARALATVASMRHSYTALSKCIGVKDSSTVSCARYYKKRGGARGSYCVFGGCGVRGHAHGLDNPSSAQNTAPIKLGLSAALTGPFNEFGEGIRRGSEIAIEEWNAAGGVLGRKVELAEVLDDQLVPDRAVQNVRRILDNPDIVALVAPGPSGPTLAVVGMVVADGRPMCNSQAQTPTIVHPDGPDKPPYPNVFSVAMSISSEAEKLGRAVSASFNKIGIISESTSYGKLGAELIKKSVLGIKPSATVMAESYNQKAQDMTAQLVRLQREGAEVIVFVGLGADAAVLRKTMTRLDIGLPLYGSSGLVTVPFMESVGDLAVGAARYERDHVWSEAFRAQDAGFPRSVQEASSGPIAGTARIRKIRSSRWRRW